LAGGSGRKARTKQGRDRLDQMLDEWRQERPEIDAFGMALVPRVMRLSYFYDRAMQSVSRRFALKPGWLDVLSSLRRGGPPYRRAATELARSVLLSSGGMTSRIDRMEQAGLVRRLPDPNDRRGVLVELTDTGHEVIDRAIDAHLELYGRLASVLTSAERKTFIDLMRKQTRAFERGDADAALD
jgi:DNA-binding MarR family transcriptional regulator